MSLLPNQIPPQDEPVGQVMRNGEVQPDETVRLTLNWYLLLLNLVQRVIGQNAPELTSLLVDDGLANAESSALSAGLASLATQTLGEPPPDFGAQAQPLASVAPGASPFVWVAPFAGHLSIVGGAVSAVTLSRQGATIPIPGQLVAQRAQFTSGAASGANSVTSGSFFPGNGNALVAFGWTTDAGAGTVTFSGTGSWSVLTPPGHFNDGGTEYYAIGVNSNAASASQTLTVTGGGTATQAVIQGIVEYSGVGSLAGSNTTRTNPGTGAGALTGTAVYAPLGARLLVYAHGESQSGTITSTAGTTLEADAFGNTIVEYAGLGANITPAFTCSNGAGTFQVQQVVIAPQVTPALIPVCRTDQVTITYSSAPVLTFIPWSDA